MNHNKAYVNQKITLEDESNIYSLFTMVYIAILVASLILALFILFPENGAVIMDFFKHLEPKYVGKLRP